MPKPHAGVASIKPYQTAEYVNHTSDGRPFIHLASNENPHGASARALAAIQAYASSAQPHRYPDSRHTALRTAIGHVHGIDPERIICGVGSDEIIAMLCRAYTNLDDEVIYPQHGFSMFRLSAKTTGARPIAAPEQDRCVSVDAILNAITPRTRLMFIANPANPTGTMVSPSEIDRLIEVTDTSILIVLDGAYTEYVDGFDGGQQCVDRYPNVFMTRTFSKIYGLGGLRIGWGYGSAQVISDLKRVRPPFNLSTVQLETATAAVLDTDYITEQRAINTRLRAHVLSAVHKMGFDADISHTNFILMRLVDEHQANACYAFLKKHAILVRPMGGYHLPQCLRLTIGTEDECDALIAALSAFVNDSTPVQWS